MTTANLHMRSEHGVTLIELMIAVALLGILATLAVPPWVEFVRGQRATSQINDLVGSVNMARSEAIKRGRDVMVCASNNPNASPPSCSGNNAWHEGWIEFVDDNSDGDYDDGTEELLRGHDTLPQATLTADGGADRLRFAADGTAPLNDDFTLDPATGTSQDEREMTLSATGRAEVKERFD